MIAITQTDLKRILAYSTISQLGYMFLALGAGTLVGRDGRHVSSVDACLFQGPVVPRRRQRDARDGRRDRHAPPRRPAAPACRSRTGRSSFGCLAIAGVFPLAGFWSKDAILLAVRHALAEAGAGGDLTKCSLARRCWAFC